MKKALFSIMAASLSVLLLAGCSGKNSENNSDTLKGETQAVENGENPVMVYKTKYCDLKYPSKWADKVSVTIDDSDVYTVKFSMGDDTPVFDLTFNASSGNLIGTLIGEDENVVIRIKDYDMSEDDERYNDFCGAAEDVNVIIENLIADYSFAAGEEVIKEDNSVFEVRTSLVTMYYPTKWQDKVDIDITDDSVKFKSSEDKLFDLNFDSDEGYLLGKYDGVTISIVSYDINSEGMSEDRYYQLCAMQEDVNVILQHLMDDEKFEIAM